MWSFLIRGSVSVVVLATLWLLTAQSFSLLIDRVYTVPLATLPSTPLGWNGTYLQFGSSVEGTEEPKGGWSSVEFQTGSRIVDLEGPGPSYHQIATLTVTDDKLVLSAGGQRLALGSRAGTLSGADGPIPAFAAEPGDETSVTLERSWLSWPTPLETNFMTGQTPSWRRHLYYRLAWKKASGASLDMLWRFEQRFNPVNGWGAPETQDRTTGLIWVDIRPVPP